MISFWVFLKNAFLTVRWALLKWKYFTFVLDSIFVVRILLAIILAQVIYDFPIAFLRAKAKEKKLTIPTCSKYKNGFIYRNFLLNIAGNWNNFSAFPLIDYILLVVLFDFSKWSIKYFIYIYRRILRHKLCYLLLKIFLMA